MIRKLLKYRDRDDLVDVSVVAARHGRFIWVARSVAPDPAIADAEPEEMPPRAICPFPGFATEDEAMADAVSLLNVVGED